MALGHVAARTYHAAASGNTRHSPWSCGCRIYHAAASGNTRHGPWSCGCPYIPCCCE
ncbi:hypothetical protein VOLCADRAFT_71973, partial [Volvox carteri f. nagariensis]